MTTWAGHRSDSLYGGAVIACWAGLANCLALNRLVEIDGAFLLSCLSSIYIALVTEVANGAEFDGDVVAL